MSTNGPPPFDLPPLGDLLPEPYEAYAEPIRAALRTFVANLPEARRADVVAAQITLGADAAAQDRLVALLREAPTLHKIGQTLARDQRLSPALRCELTALESLPPRPLTAPEQARLRELARSNGADDSLFELADAQTLAEGSVAIVTPVRWLEAPFAGTEAVIKLLKPGVEETIREDLDALYPAAEAFEDTCRAQGRRPRRRMSPACSSRLPPSWSARLSWHASATACTLPRASCAPPASTFRVRCRLPLSTKIRSTASP